MLVPSIRKGGAMNTASKLSRAASDGFDEGALTPTRWMAYRVTLATPASSAIKPTDLVLRVVSGPSTPSGREIASGSTKSHGGIVRHNLHHDHGQRLGLRRIDLAWHD
jgi:hypothetical protein